MCMDNEDCEECSKVVSLERVLAISGMVAGALIIMFAADLLTGGRLSDMVNGLRKGSDE